jgi:hypothetical protein
MLGVVQKKGNPLELCGRLVVYAKIRPSVNPETGRLPFASMVRNGLLVVKGEFKANDTFKHFMQHELGESMNDGISEMIEHIKEQGGEIPEGMDPEAFRERLDELSNMEVIPVPAKIIFCDTEDEILQEDADIYYIGEFSGLSQAHLCITSLPIFYQAQYREQQASIEQKYINEILSQIEGNEAVDIPKLKASGEFLPGEGTLNTFIGNLLELLGGRVVPYLLYQVSDEAEYQVCIRRFYDFMKPYPNPSDIDAIDRTIQILRKETDNKKAQAKLELLCEKVSALYHEEFERIPGLQKELEALE